MGEYSNWSDIPENLKTKTQLKKMGLRPSPGQEPVGRKVGGYGPYDLYEVEQATQRREPTEAQLAALEKARTASRESRTCKGCGYVQPLNPPRHLPAVWRGECESCRDTREHFEMLERDRAEQIEWAKQILDSGEHILVIDSETASLYGEIIELAIIDLAGRAVFNKRFRVDWVSDEASRVHGITVDDLKDCRPFEFYHQQVRDILLGADRLIIYNAPYDMQRLDETCLLHGVKGIYPETEAVNCLMRRYARYAGEYSEWHDDYKWQRLPGGDHSAISDCRAALDLIRRMAREGEADQ